MSQQNNLDKQMSDIANKIEDGAEKAKDVLIEKTNKAGEVIGEGVEKTKDVLEGATKVAIDESKKAKDALEKSFKNIGDVAVKSTTEIVKEISNPNFSSCLHKTSLFVSVVLALFAANYYKIDEKFILNFIFFFIIIYIIYNAILNMLY
jgi:hypothetical protein